MSDFIDFIFDLLTMSWVDFKIYAGGIATIGAGALVSAFWPFDTDKTLVMNSFMVFSMMLFGGILLYRLFRKAA